MLLQHLEHLEKNCVSKDRTPVSWIEKLEFKQHCSLLHFLLVKLRHLARGRAVIFQQVMGLSCFPVLWRLLPTGHHWHTEIYACTQAAVTSEVCLNKMLALTVGFEYCSFCQFSNKDPSWLVVNCSKSGWTSWVRHLRQVFSFVDLALSSLIPREMQIPGVAV